MPKIITKEEKIRIINEYNNCCTTKEKDDMVKKYGYVDRNGLYHAITDFKKYLGIKINKVNNYGYDTDEKKLAIIKTWEKSSKEEKEELAKAHNTTYKKFKSAIVSYRSRLNINSTNRILTIDEKIKLIEDYNKTKYKAEKEELAKKYGMNLNVLYKMVSDYRRQLNIKEMSIKRYTDEEKLEMVRQWDYDHTGFIGRYGYKSYKTALNSISKFRKLLREKGLI